MRMKTTRDVDTMVSAMLAGVKLTSNGAIHGEPEACSRWGTGRLAAEYVESVTHATYVLYSYSTPMAWRNPDGTWTMPLDKYSITTSRHQGVIRRAVRMLEETRSAMMGEATELLGLPRALVGTTSVPQLRAPRTVRITMDRTDVADEFSIALDSIARRLDNVKRIEQYARAVDAQAKRGENIAMEDTPYGADGTWHSRSHP